MRIVIEIEIDNGKAEDIRVQGVRAADLASPGPTEHADVDAGPAADMEATVVQLPRPAGSPDLMDLDAGDAGAAPTENSEREDKS